MSYANVTYVVKSWALILVRYTMERWHEARNCIHELSLVENQLVLN